jgi:radical SAM family uncharacterized protein/radical SAM-linked protein
MPWLEPQDLLRVEKPSRYMGHEWNAVQKDPDALELRLVLAFPDLYDLALGNLGLQILYGVLNQLPWLWAERVYAPAPDLEAMLRSRGRPLVSLDSGTPLSAYDGVGFSLQSELTYTNLLNMLDLAGIPLRAEERGEGSPLIFAGGPNAVNPEPLAPFMDFFLIGDGEEAVLEIAQTMREHRGLPRRQRLEALAGIQGVYVPSMVSVAPSDRGVMVEASGKARIQRRVLEDLEGAWFPTRPVMPFTSLVHDRIAIEVLRGCTRGCRFCQAGATTRPVRERSPARVVQLMQESLAATGHEEVSLLSLSTCDHSRAAELVNAASGAAKGWRASVALPSIRLDGFSIQLAEAVSDVRRSGLTFAPEAATPRLRAVINKPLEDEQLLGLAEEACARGWGHLKLYFMIGLPSETDDDVRAIADLSHRVLRAARGSNRRARLNLGVSTFVPKAWTPFQWSAQISRDETRRRQRLLAEALGRSKAIRFGRHDVDESWIEGLVARGDRRMADVIERAWSLGCRFDAWSEHRRTELWERALAESGYDPQWSSRSRQLDERLPWDHIDPGLDPSWLREEWDRAAHGGVIEDCRQGSCHSCGSMKRVPEACGRMLKAARSGAQDMEALAPPAPRPDPGRAPQGPAPAMRVVLRVGRLGQAALLSHHEVMGAWIRIARRARVPLAYTQGFHEHPRVAFAAALPVGESSIDCYVDLVLADAVPLQELERRLREQLPEGFHILGIAEAELRTPSLMSLARGVVYTLRVPLDGEPLAAEIDRLLAQERLEVVRRTKKGRRSCEVRGSIELLAPLSPAADQEGAALVALVLRDPPQGSRIRPRELLERLGQDPDDCRVCRVRTLMESPEGQLISLGKGLGITLSEVPPGSEPRLGEVLSATLMGDAG